MTSDEAVTSMEYVVITGVEETVRVELVTSDDELVTTGLDVVATAVVLKVSDVKDVSTGEEVVTICVDVITTGVDVVTTGVENKVSDTV